MYQPSIGARIVCLIVLLACILSVPLSAVANEPIDQNPEAPSPNLILFYDGSSVPSGWTLQSSSGGPFYQRYPRGASSYGGYGGTDTHTHSLGMVSCSSPSSTLDGVQGSTGSYASGAHTHSISSPSVSSVSNLPLSRNLKVIKYTNGIPSTIPAGAIAMFDTMPSSPWTRYSAQDGYFIRGETTITTLGSNTHTHSVSISTSGPSQTALSDTGATTVASSSHTHTGSGTSASSSNEPPFITVILAKTPVDTPIPYGMIAMFDAALSPPWVLMSGSGGPFEGRFIKGGTSFGSTGGGETHSHSNLNIVTSTASNSGTLAQVTPLTAFTPQTHTHTITVSFSTSSHLPPYINVIIGKFSPSPPSAPQNLQATPKNTKVNLTWMPPASDGGAPVTNYKVYRNGSFHVMLGPVLTYTDSNLINGVTYYYKVSAVNAAGEGPFSNEVAGTPTLTPPSAPGGLNVIPGNKKNTLSWTPPSDNGGKPITAYRIYRSTSPGAEKFLVMVSGSTLTYIDKPLKNGVTYYYQVSAVNAIGEGPRSSERSATPSTVPGAPRSLTATPGNAEVTLTWLAPQNDGGSPITSYNVYQSQDGLIFIYINSTGTLTYTDTNLKNGKKYYYRVKAVNSAGEGPYSSTVNATPVGPPDSPRDVHVVPGLEKVTVSWSQPLNNNGGSVTAYKIYRGTNPGSETFLLMVSGTQTSYTDTAVTPGIRYFYRVSAVNSGGEGPKSGAKWTKMDPPTAPPASDGYAMAYDSQSDKVILFGGSWDETWAYDYSTNIWRNMNPGSNRPTNRYDYAMTYDSQNDVVIFFGGMTYSAQGLYDTWVYSYETNQWMNMSPSTHPPGRGAHAMAYDSQSHKVILFGGSGPGYLDDTWVYDFKDNTWTNMNPSTKPSARYKHVMVYDSQSDRVILFGGNTASGYVNDTWAYDYETNTWTNMNPSNPPPARTATAMAYNSQSDRAILFGGYSGIYLDDTWAYDYNTNTWTNMNPSLKPKERYGHAMAYDSQSNRIILFGGWCDGYLDDTWAYDGTTWVDMHPPSLPGYLEGHAMAYDSQSDRVIMFGGEKTWAYNYEMDVWVNMNPTARPTGRSSHAMAYDSQSDRIVLFGGRWGESDTWAYDYETNSWMNMNPITRPGWRLHPAMAYDSESDRIIMFGGYNDSGYLGDTWAYDYDTNTWTNMNPVNRPSPRYGHAIAYDSQSDRVILFGGWDGSRSLDDTWAYDYNTNTWINMSPSSRPDARDGHAMVYDSQNDRVIMFGAWGYVDTWAYDYNTNTWSNIDPAINPPERRDPAMAYDSQSGKVILFGGSGYEDTWAFESSPSGVPYTSPTPPRTLVATSGNSEITLTWQAPIFDGGYPITMYLIHRGTTSGGETLYYTINGNTYSFTDDNVNSGMKYFYYVTASNSQGATSDPSNEVNATAKGVPGKPTIISAIGGSRKVTLTWQPPASDGGSPITSYQIWRGTTPGGQKSFLIAYSGSATSGTDWWATPGVTYYYVIRAVNAAGPGEFSDEVSAVASASAPPIEPFYAPIMPGPILVILLLTVLLTAIIPRIRPISIPCRSSILS